MSKSTTSLLEEVLSIPSRRGGPIPTIQRIMSSLSKEDANDLESALNNPEIPVRSITSVLNKRGHKISVSTIQKYRRDHEIV